MSDRKKVDETVPGQEIIFHFCDDSDIRTAAGHPDTFIEQNIMGLFYVLEAMRRNGVRSILFPSSTTVFGELANPPAREADGPMKPLNIYGGAKLASEGLISAWAHTYDFCALVFRFVGIIGGRMDHGVIHDFVRKTAKGFHAIGNSRRRHATTFLRAGGRLRRGDAVRPGQKPERCRLVHIGNVDQIPINEAADVITGVMNLKNVKLAHTGGKVGWKGDVTSNFIATETLTAWGWKPCRTSREAVLEAATRLTSEMNHK